MSGQEVAKWADTSMFEAEKTDTSEGTVAYLLGAPADPLGQIVACILMYQGRTITDLSQVTDDERRLVMEQMQKTVLAMPLEAVQFHFMVTGVHRGITHQMVRQRTAAYAQESTRFAVKRDLKTAVALPPSLMKTVSASELAKQIRARDEAQGLQTINTAEADDALVAEEVRAGRIKGAQLQRLRWDEAVEVISETYNWLVDDGMAAEEARGLMPTNIVTRLNYITNLRNFLTEMGKRLSDQAQFEWRAVAMAFAKALREYGKTQSYWTTITLDQYHTWDQRYPSNPILEREFKSRNEALESQAVRVRLSSAWQYEQITYAMKPVEFQKGGIAFGASFDRPSRIAERVREFASRGIPSEEWMVGSVEHGIPPIHPDEWLLDPNSARLEAGMEFDVFGNRVPIGTGWHFDGDTRNGGGRLLSQRYTKDGTEYVRHATWPTDFPENGTSLA